MSQSDLDAQKEILNNALIEINSMKLSIDGHLKNKEFFDSWPSSSKEKEFLKPTKKWDKIKVAPITVIPYNLMNVATYPDPPEEIPLCFEKNIFHVTSNWRAAKIDFMRGGRSEVSDLDDSFDDVDDIDWCSKNNNSNNKKKEQKDIWKQKLIDIDVKSNLSIEFERKHSSFFIEPSSRDRTELESILEFAKQAPLLFQANEPSNSKPIMEKKIHKPIDFDFDKVADAHCVQILTKRDFYPNQT
jgi:hypothetical protein